MKKISAIILTVMLSFGLCVSTYAFSDTLKEKLKGTVVLYLNVPKAYVDGEEKVIDSDNKQIYPKIVQNTTMIPLRFAAESIKADVKWDVKSSSAFLSLNGKTIKITTGSTRMYVNGKVKILSVPAKNIGGKLFIPLRAIAEAFDKKVFWNDNGFIIIGNRDKPLDSEEEILEVLLKKYDIIRTFCQGLAVIKRDDKWGYIDKAGKEVIEPKYDDAYSFKEGLAEVKRGGKWGYIDQTGKEVTGLKYDDADPFSEGLAVVKRDNKWRYIDQTGKEVIEPGYDDAYSFKEGLARVIKEGKWGYIDQTGKEVIGLKYDSADPFSQGLAVIKRDDKWGYIDKAGKEVIEPKYDDAYSFKEGLAEVKRGGKWGYIDQTGKEVTGLKYDSADPFSQGLAVIKRDDKWGYIDKAGKEVIEPGYDDAYSFIKGLARVMKDGKWGYIDQTGKEVIELKYDEAYSFDSGLGRVKIDGRWFLINKEGKETTLANYLVMGKKAMINIQTDKGNIKIAVNPELMPITTENFLSLVKKGFYDALTFHRVEDWVIQGGDPKGNGTGGSDKTIKLETNDKLKNIRGAVAMARTNDPDSASSQFYILKTDASWLDGNYAVFGNVVSGMDVVDSIAVGDKMVKVEKAE